METLTLAVDLGGTKVEAALVTEDGAIVPGSRHRAPTGPAAGAAEVDAAVREVVVRAKTSADRPIAAAGIGSAGPIDRDAGTVSPLNLPLDRFPLVASVRAAIVDDVPAHLALDGTCIALAEARFGAARGIADSMSMVVSTGVGGGIILGGRPVPGATGNAGHIGQLRLSPNAPRHGAREGTVEELASGPASVAWAREHGWIGDSGEDLAHDAAAGDPTARAAIERSAEAVGQAVAGVSALLDIRLFVIGGGFSFAAPDYVELVEAAARAAAVLPGGRHVRAVRAGLGNEAPLVGAACLAQAAGIPG
ncbi:ROK family protein [Microbacterium hominis]|uniref:ROK family protein n=1 Tax=Microbacterium hominis TaxID=162426 RepID=A0A7D4UGZ3_9MICO|nr:ROK family protein [Microbacterium hominis]QKJ20389.1 ROK family protein [Microbacterium hominis]